jgi:hypothetical protein
MNLERDNENEFVCILTCRSAFTSLVPYLTISYQQENLKTVDLYIFVFDLEPEGQFLGTSPL